MFTWGHPSKGGDSSFGEKEVIMLREDFAALAFGGSGVYNISEIEDCRPRCRSIRGLAVSWWSNTDSVRLARAASTSQCADDACYFLDR